MTALENNPSYEYLVNKKNVSVFHIKGLGLLRYYRDSFDYRHELIVRDDITVEELTEWLLSDHQCLHGGIMEYEIKKLIEEKSCVSD